MVPISSCSGRKVTSCEMDMPVLGSLTVDTDAAEMPNDFTSKLYKKLGTDSYGLGRMLTASFRPYVGKNRRLSSGNKNAIVIDFETSSTLPTRTQVSDVATAACSLLDTKECAQKVSFKSDTSGDSVVFDMDIAPKNPGSSDIDIKRLAPVAALIGVTVFITTCFVVALRRRRSSQRANMQAADATQESSAKPEEGKKADAEDDNASTATPDASDTRSLPSLKADDFALDDSSISDRV